MSVLRSAPFGAACLLYAALLGAAPHSTPPSVAAAPLREALQAVWQASPEVQAARAERDAARARAR
ncbi:MAG TPA: TolC family protein, partial [Rhodanobacter sp.]|nr:TolC family protein [Rhodanobacter sp.]